MQDARRGGGGEADFDEGPDLPTRRESMREESEEGEFEEHPYYESPEWEDIDWSEFEWDDAYERVGDEEEDSYGEA